MGSEIRPGYEKRASSVADVEPTRWGAAGTRGGSSMRAAPKSRRRTLRKTHRAVSAHPACGCGSSNASRASGGRPPHYIRKDCSPAGAHRAHSAWNDVRFIPRPADPGAPEKAILPLHVIRRSSPRHPPHGRGSGRSSSSRPVFTACAGAAHPSGAFGAVAKRNGLPPAEIRAWRSTARSRSRSRGAAKARRAASAWALWAHPPGGIHGSIGIRPARLRGTSTWY